MKTTKNNPAAVISLQDSPRDKAQLRDEEVTLDLPDVTDIPGQEHIKPLRGGELADITVSSADEEGNDLLDTDEDRLLTRADANVSREEKELLRQTSESIGTEDDLKLRNAQVDSRDGDGDLLNEGADVSGRDLDIEGSEDDDEDEDLGEEDEENNVYSLGADKENQNSGNQ